jgi:integrase
MKVTFYLRKEKKSKQTGLIPVAVLVTESGLIVRKNIPGVKVLEEDWNKLTQRIESNKKGKENSHSIEFNFLLDEINHRLNELWKKYFLIKKPLNEELIIQAIEDNLKENQDLDQKEFLSTFQEFIDQNKSHRAAQTIKGYVTAKNTMKAFLEETNSRLFLEDIDLQFFDNFRNYCFEKRNYLNNTFSKIVSNIKTFMTWTENRGYHSNLIYKKFKAEENEIEVVYLDLNELMLFYHFEFENPKHAKARDVYCFSSFSGLRYCDLAMLNDSNIHEDEIKFTIGKTRTIDHVVPLNDLSKSILDKYKGGFYSPLPMVTSQKLNKSIKEACEIMGFDNPLNITRYSGGKRIEQIVPKYSRITIHTARKTFVTNSLMLGMNLQVIKNITAHKKDASFQKYLKISDSFKSREMGLWDSIRKNK